MFHFFIGHEMLRFKIVLIQRALLCFRNHLLFDFETIGTRLLDTNVMKQLFYLVPFITRMLVLPESEFNMIPNGKRMLQRLGLLAHIYWEMAYGTHRATSNVHLFLGHASELRDGRPVTSYSAFPSECEYSIVRASVKLGTRNTEKQAATALLMRNIRNSKQHSCQRQILLSEKRGNTKSERLLLWKSSALK